MINCFLLCKKLYVLFIVMFLITSCKKIVNVYPDYQHVTTIAGEDFTVCDFGLFNKCKIYMLKSHQAGQMLSIIVRNEKDELVIFDGGRTEDGKFLCDFIKSFGGNVKYWFLTHIHDDHIGAIYDIFTNHPNEVYIENLCYSFADFDWYYEKAGNDAGALTLFENAKDNYVNMLASKNLTINIDDKVAKNDIFGIDNIQIKVMNNIYLLDSDSINNTSITYKASIENKTMIILGDLGYEAGELYYKEYEDSDELKSDIVVLAHHGQGGVDFPIYQKIAPIIALWPTTEYIYENKSGKLHTNDTKKWLQDLEVKENILSYKTNYIIQ